MFIGETKMSYLKNLQVYLAGPMFAVEDDGVSWRDMITPELQRMGLTIEDPCKKTTLGITEVKDDKAMFKQLVAGGDFREVKNMFQPIVRKDLRCVDKSDFLIVYYNPTLHMFGTIHEMVVAHWQQKPILCKYDKEHQEAGLINPWLMTLVNPEWMFSDWDAILDHLRQVDAGIYDEDYWSI